jgi:hypothetical protein
MYDHWMVCHEWTQCLYVTGHRSRSNAIVIKYSIFGYRSITLQPSVESCTSMNDHWMVYHERTPCFYVTMFGGYYPF